METQGTAVLDLEIELARLGLRRQNFYTAQELAELFRLQERTIRGWISERKVDVVKVGSSVRIPAREVVRLIREGLRPAV